MSGRQRATLLGLAAAVAVAAVLVALVGGGGDGDDGVIDTRTETAATTPRPSATTAPATPTIVVRDGAPVGGVRRLSFKKGSTIRFAVRSDTADEVHFHGYDVAKDVVAGGTVRFSVPATIDGRFEVELEQRGTQIAEIEVVP